MPIVRLLISLLMREKFCWIERRNHQFWIHSVSDHNFFNWFSNYLWGQIICYFGAFWRNFWTYWWFLGKNMLFYIFKIFQSFFGVKMVKLRIHKNRVQLEKIHSLIHRRCEIIWFSRLIVSFFFVNPTLTVKESESDHIKECSKRENENVSHHQWIKLHFKFFQIAVQNFMTFSGIFYLDTLSSRPYWRPIKMQLLPNKMRFQFYEVWSCKNWHLDELDFRRFNWITHPYLGNVISATI